jgi:hypothetical protein
VPYAAIAGNLHTLNNPSVGELATVAREFSLPGLMIFDYRLDTLAPLQIFTDLQVLKMQGGAKLHDLEPLATMISLRELVLSTPTGSDGSGRTINVASYAPLARLTRLERLGLHGVRPRDLDLSSIAEMRHLRALEIGGVKEFGLEHFARLSAALPETEGRTLRPFAHIPGWTPCQKCRGEVVILNGAAPRSRKFVCQRCHAKLVAAHVAKWEQAKSLQR